MLKTGIHIFETNQLIEIIKLVLSVNFSLNVKITSVVTVGGRYTTGDALKNTTYLSQICQSNVNAQE